MDDQPREYYNGPALDPDLERVVNGVLYRWCNVKEDNVDGFIPYYKEVKPVKVPRTPNRSLQGFEGLPASVSLLILVNLMKPL